MSTNGRFGHELCGTFSIEDSLCRVLGLRSRHKQLRKSTQGRWLRFRTGGQASDYGAIRATLPVPFECVLAGRTIVDP